MSGVDDLYGGVVACCDLTDTCTQCGAQVDPCQLTVPPCSVWWDQAALCPGCLQDHDVDCRECVDEAMAELAGKMRAL